MLFMNNKSYKQRVAEFLIDLEHGEKNPLEVYSSILELVQEADEKLVEIKETVVHDTSVELNRRIFELENMLEACRENSARLRSEINKLRNMNSPAISKYKNIMELCIERGNVDGR